MNNFGNKVVQLLLPDGARILLLGLSRTTKAQEIDREDLKIGLPVSDIVLPVVGGSAKAMHTQQSRPTRLGLTGLDIVDRLPLPRPVVGSLCYGHTLCNKTLRLSV